MTQHVKSFAQSWPDWIPEHIRQYILHKRDGESLRGLAREEGCHASTLVRKMQQVERARGDGLVAEALGWLGEGVAPTGCHMETTNAVFPGFSTTEAAETARIIERHLLPSLRRLSQPGAVLAVAPRMDRAVIVRDTRDGEAQRLGVIERPVAMALALNGWIACTDEEERTVSRYQITQAGRTRFKQMLARNENRAGGFSETPGTFRARPRSSDFLRRRLNQLDTPVLALSRRRNPDGSAFLEPELVRAAQRIQDDYELAQMEPRVATNWADFLAAGVSGHGLADPAFRGAPDARARVTAALRDLGPGLGDVVLECCCRLQGLETAEKTLGWSARSGKIVLRIALQRLRKHYEGLKDGGGLIG